MKSMHRHKFFLTYSQCDLSTEEIVDELNMRFLLKYYLVAHENHKDGGNHFHVYLHFEKETRVNLKAKPDYFDIKGYHPNVRDVFDWKGLVKYCTKDGDWTANFDINCKKTHRAMKNHTLLTEDPNRLVDTGEITLFQLTGLKRARELYYANAKSDKVLERKCYWIYGEPGVGKSYIARDLDTDIYEKSINKWWDGYKNQKLVLIDDFDKTGKCLGHYLKIWADNYRFTAETKGGTIMPTYTTLVITSNYTIESLFEDEEEQKAIKRRFKCIEMLNRAAQKQIKDEISGSLQGMGKNEGAEMAKKPKKHLVKSKFLIYKDK